MGEFIGADPAQAHALRVSAIACELGKRLGLSESQLSELQWAALRHGPTHRFESTSTGLERMLADLMGGQIALSAPDRDPGVGQEILNAFRDVRQKTMRVYSAVEIVTIAQAIDVCLEFEPFSGSDSEASAWDSPLAQVGLSTIRRADRESLRQVAKKLPVFPRAAVTALRALINDEIDVAELERIASTDPVLAGSIVSQANSALFNPRQEIRSVGRAITQVGAMAARRLLMAALLRPIYDSPCMRPFWQHTVEAADAAAQIAERSGALPPSEAALAGLVHDIGILAVSLLQPEAVSACDRMISAGCPRTAAEWVICGFDHAEASAIVLETWDFPKDLIEAVRYHHRPERCDSALAATLYLVEFWTATDEDLPSRVRLLNAARRLALPAVYVNTMRPQKVASHLKLA